MDILEVLEGGGDVAGKQQLSACNLPRQDGKVFN
jgi:hypothetical protein